MPTTNQPEKAVEKTTTATTATGEFIKPDISLA